MKAPLLISVLLACTSAWAADITVSGEWIRTVTASDLTAGAGSDLVSEQTSSAGTVTLALTATGGGAWRIKVRHAPSPWNGNLTLWVRRTSDGTGAGSLSGGSGYVQLTALDTDFFSGAGDRSNISLQYKLSGLSKTVSPDTYQSAVVFTIE